MAIKIQGRDVVQEALRHENPYIEDLVSGMPHEGRPVKTANYAYEMLRRQRYRDPRKSKTNIASDPCFSNVH